MEKIDGNLLLASTSSPQKRLIDGSDKPNECKQIVAKKIENVKSSITITTLKKSIVDYSDSDISNHSIYSSDFLEDVHDVVEFMIQTIESQI